MTETELASLLRETYETAPYRRKHSFVVLFGIKYSEQLKSHSISSVCALSGIGKWGPQVSMGVQLADYVTPK